MSDEKPKAAAPARKSPADSTPGQLKKFGVSVAAGDRPFALPCDRCGASWSPGART